MGDIGKTSDKGKSQVTTERRKVADPLRNQVKEKLMLDPQRDILKGGSGSSSKQQGGPNWVLGVGGPPIQYQTPPKMEYREPTQAIKLPKWNIGGRESTKQQTDSQTTKQQTTKQKSVTFGSPTYHHY